MYPRFRKTVFSVPEAAREAGKSETLVRNAIRCGDLRATNVSQGAREALRIERADLEQWVAGRRAQPEDTWNDTTGFASAAALLARLVAGERLVITIGWDSGRDGATGSNRRSA